MIAYPEGRERRREARRLGEGSRGRREVHGKGKAVWETLIYKAAGLASCGFGMGVGEI